MKNGFKNNYFNKKQLDFLNENSIRSAFDRTGKGKAGIVADLSLGNPTSDFPSKSLTKQIKKILKSPLPRGFFSYMDNAGYKETRKAVALDLVRSNYFSTELKLDESKIPGILLAVTEAVTNAIIHANKCINDKMVHINVYVKEEKLYISVKDEGTGFDPAKVPDPTEPENLLKDSGRGLYLMRIYMDDLKYNVTPTGTETILILNL